MRKFMFATVIVGAFVLYSLLYGWAHLSALQPATANDPNTTTRPSVSSTAPASSTPTTGASGSSTSTPTTPSGSLYKDGSYTGSQADAQWGYIQVKAIIKNGKITDVQFLQYPNERNRSVEINAYADPQLTTEAIQAQSANVDVITGATDTSQAFIQSLTDALNQAKA
jgi:uncharacterized protein with FMN-binding domain